MVGTTVLKNCYQKAQMSLIAVMMSSKKKLTSWTYGFDLGWRTLEVNDLDVPCAM